MEWKMELANRTVEAHIVRSGVKVAELVAGEKLGIGQRNPDEVWLLETVPEGKQWLATITVEITETNA